MARFMSGLRYEDVPAEVIARIKLLMLDALGCGLYGANTLCEAACDGLHAGAIIHDHLLAETFSQALRHHAGHEVTVAACFRGNNAHHATGVLLTVRRVHHTASAGEGRGARGGFSQRVCRGAVEVHGVHSS